MMFSRRVIVISGISKGRRSASRRRIENWFFVASIELLDTVLCMCMNLCSLVLNDV